MRLIAELAGDRGKTEAKLAERFSLSAGSDPIPLAEDFMDCSFGPLPVGLHNYLQRGIERLRPLPVLPRQARTIDLHFGRKASCRNLIDASCHLLHQPDVRKCEIDERSQCKRCGHVDLVYGDGFSHPISDDNAISAATRSRD